MQQLLKQNMLPLQRNSVSSAESVIDSSSQSATLQRHASLAKATAQRAEAPRPNNTGLPDNLKSGIESLSGFSMDDVRVHYNSSKPATVQALAYTQGTDIHVAPGQEKHLPHEAWHVAQQMAGRVSPTTNINGMPVNDNAGLEHEADVMGEKALVQRKDASNALNCKNLNVLNNVAQCVSLPHIKVVNPLETLPRLPLVNGTSAYPHIAFESLAGGNRVNELSELYNNVIYPYDGCASVYMGVNACRYEYKKYKYEKPGSKGLGSGVKVSKRNDADAENEVKNAVNEVKSKIGNKKRNHSITLIPFIWDMVGLEKVGTEDDLNAANKWIKDEETAKAGVKSKAPTAKVGVKSKVPTAKVDSKSKSSPTLADEKPRVWLSDEDSEHNKVFDEKTSMFKKTGETEYAFPNAAAYVFPFYEARTLVMEKASSCGAALYRWIDSDVRDDSSIEKIDQTYAEKNMGSGTEGAVVSSGCYEWRPNEDGKWQKKQPGADLKSFFEILNRYEKKCRALFWSVWKNKTEKDVFKKETGYIPEPIAYMNAAAHAMAIENFEKEIEREGRNIQGKQDRESEIAFDQMKLVFFDDFVVSKPVKDYFDKMEPAKNEEDFRDAMNGAHQSAFGNWKTDKPDDVSFKTELLDSAWREYNGETKFEESPSMAGPSMAGPSIAGAIGDLFEKVNDKDVIINFIKVSEVRKDEFKKHLSEYLNYAKFLDVLKAFCNWQEAFDLLKNNAADIKKIVECMIEQKVGYQDILSGLSKEINVSAECMEKIVDYMHKQKVEPQKILNFIKKQNLSLDPIVEKYFFTYDTEKSGGSKTEEPLLSKLKISGVDDLCKAKAPVDLIASVIKNALNELKLDYGEEIRFTIENLVNKMLCCDYSLGCVSAILKPIKDKVKSFGKVQLEEILKNCRFNTDQIKYFSNEIFPPPKR